MSWGGPAFVIAIIALSMGAWVITTWIRARHGYPLDDDWTGMGNGAGSRNVETDRKVELLANENGDLKDKIVRLEDRISVLERIATDKGTRLSDEIEKLREE